MNKLDILKTYYVDKITTRLDEGWQILEALINDGDISQLPDEQRGIVETNLRMVIDDLKTVMNWVYELDEVIDENK